MIDTNATAEGRDDSAGQRTPGLPRPPGPSRTDRAVTHWTMDELRAERRRLRDEEADLSYLRRLVQGRIDILRAESDRRAGGAPEAADAGALVDRLSRILADTPSARGSVRHVGFAPPRTRRYQRLAEALLNDTRLADLDACDDTALAAALSHLETEETRLSRRRHDVQRRADDCATEMSRRYREGLASVDELLDE